MICYCFLAYCLINAGLGIMPGKGRRLQTRPIIPFLDLEGEEGVVGGNPQPGNGEQRCEQQLDSSVTLQAIRQIIVQEVGHLEIGLKKIQDYMGEAFNSLEKCVESKLSDIAQKIDVLERGQNDVLQQVEKVKAQVVSEENNVNKVGTALRMVEEAYGIRFSYSTQSWKT